MIQSTPITTEQITAFWRNGYLKIEDALSTSALSQLQNETNMAFHNPTPPWELESQLAYPGAPTSANEEGGATVRRLLGAYARNPLWAKLASAPSLAHKLAKIFNAEHVYLSQTHHNCLMTKLPQFSSDTGWHQDIRYWSFTQNNLITAWFAMGKESKENGGLRIVPGSHQLQFEAKQFDDKVFFKSDLPENKTLLDKEISLELAAGDLLLFHSRLLHCANRNKTAQAKLALVFTYFAEGNSAIENTRSASLEAIQVI